MKDFTRPDASLIELGKTTRGDVIKIMHREADSDNKKLINNAMINLMEFSYMGTNNNSDIAEIGYVPAKTQYFYLNDADVVIGTEYHSSFEMDSTRFDVSKVPGIVKGTTRKEDVIAMLGAPTIQLIKPLSSEAADSSIGYHYRNLRISPKIMTNSYKLVVDFDVHNVVTNISFDSREAK
jgi:hypothetical protein